MSKKGDPQMKRKLAHEAHRKGRKPSELDATTGAAKQRRHLGNKEDHEVKLDARHRNQSPGPARGKVQPPNY